MRWTLAVMFILFAVLSHGVLSSIERALAQTKIDPSQQRWSVVGADRRVCRAATCAGMELIRLVYRDGTSKLYVAVPTTPEIANSPLWEVP